MVKRILYVGGMDDLERLSEQYRGRLVPDQHYVFGEHCDATEEAALMWADLRRAFSKAHLTQKQRYAVAKSLCLWPIAEIARKMGIHRKIVYGHLKLGFAKLDRLPPGNLGCFTDIVESCGGWGQVRHYVEDIRG
jgi:DNA-binding CsgD family transcriptional regulator